MKQNYTKQAQKVLDNATKAAGYLAHGYIGSEHLLVALLDEENVAGAILTENGVESEKLGELIEQLISPKKAKTEKPEYSPELVRILENAQAQAQQSHSLQVGTEHLLLGLLTESDCVAVRLLNTMGVAPQKLYFATLEAMGRDVAKAKAEFATKQSRTQKGKEDKMLSQYSRDLTELARLGKLDPVIGRKDEIQRLVRILSRRTKNNPCLVGEPGVGKTAVVEGLAAKIVSGEVPENMRGMRLLSLDLSAMVAGTKYRGEFEERIKAVMEEVIQSGNILIFIDEIHTMIGAGGAEGAMDASNIMKPALARGEFRVIGATTREEYRKHMEKDAALERRFQPVVVEEPTETETVEILRGLRPVYEAHHGVKIGEDAVLAAVKLSKRYINDRFLPDKAIDVLDEAASMLRLENAETSSKAFQQKKKMEELEKEKEALLLAGDTEGALRLVSRQKRLKKQQTKQEEEVLVLTENEIAGVISTWTKIPLSKLCEEENARLRALPDTLKKRVIGQEDAVMAVAKAIRRARVGLQNPNRPLGSFLFLGPTGVGKTELSKALAEAVFGKEDALIRVDMSEYMEKHSVSKMIGSPPGYVGHEEGGQLCESVRRNPYSVVLFDELEKAHPDVFNILLQVLEDGHMTDSQGRKVSFKNTVIIMTSNTGARGMLEQKSLGFLGSRDEKADYERMRQDVMEEVKKTFKPEFINRIDETIVFRPLDEEALRQIAALQISFVVKRCKEQLGMKLSIADDVKEFIRKKGSDVKFGARPIRRAVQVYLEDMLAEEILNGSVAAGDNVSVSVDGERLTAKRSAKRVSAGRTAAKKTASKKRSEKD